MLSWSKEASLPFFSRSLLHHHKNWYVELPSKALGFLAWQRLLVSGLLRLASVVEDTLAWEQKCPRGRQPSEPGRRGLLALVLYLSATPQPIGCLAALAASRCFARGRDLDARFEAEDAGRIIISTAGPETVTAGAERALESKADRCQLLGSYAPRGRLDSSDPWRSQRKAKEVQRSL